MTLYREAITRKNIGCILLKNLNTTSPVVKNNNESVLVEKLLSFSLQK